MKKALQILMVFASLTLMLSACGKKKDSNDAEVTAARDSRLGSGSNGALPSGQQYSPGSEAAVYADASMASQFNDYIKVLVSATMDPSNVGYVNPNNGVKIKGVVRVDPTTGRIDTANSKIELSIQDDLKNSNGQLYEPIVITVLGTSGTAINNRVNLVFSDQYGSITLSGTWDNTTYHGVVSFSNTKPYNGKYGGVLGKFDVPVCGFFKCN